MTFDLEQCWLWPGKLRKEDGRAVVGHQYAYRLVYEAATGAPCPEGVAHHTCENKACVNPWHLTFITQAEHLREHGLPGDWGQAKKTHCPAGHPYDDENTYRIRGERRCRECMRKNSREYQQRRRAKRV